MRRSKRQQIKVEYEQVGDQDQDHETKKIKNEEASAMHVKEPANWREIYNLVKEMRSRILAPVDTMGCERLPEPVSKVITPKVHRYQLLVALMLSAQTKDEVTAAVMANLRSHIPGGLNIDGILQTSESDLDKLIYKVGFHSRKANYIKRTTEILRRDYDDDVPATVSQMVGLPGVGPKMANLLAHRAWNKVEGIGVDVHIDRLACMWRWVGKGQVQGNPEKTRLALESWLPREFWVDINPMLVGFGQTVCLPRGKRCEICTLAPTGLCKNVDRARIKKMRALAELNETQLYMKDVTVKTEDVPIKQESTIKREDSVKRESAKIEESMVREDTVEEENATIKSEELEVKVKVEVE